MALPRTVDVKLCFIQYDCKPGREGFERFQQDLVTHGGSCDDQGWSLTECLMRQDDGALDAAGIPMPGIAVIPAAGGGSGADKRRAARRKRLKESHKYIVAHISNQDFLRALSVPPYLGDGPRALDFIQSKCNTPMDTVDTQDKQAEWHFVTIAKDIGVTRGVSPRYR